MILSTGMRTDIPAFYSEWLINRVKEGYVCVRNPYFPKQVTRYALDPKTVDCLTFCTKNPLPLIKRLDKLNGFRQFWFVTLTPYGKDIEPNVPDKNLVIDGFKTLSERFGKHAVSWRYDPVLYGEGFDEDRHVEGFSSIAKALKGYTDACVLSFLDLYEKVKRNAPNIYSPSPDKQKSLLRRLVPIATENGITIRSCCEGQHLKSLGVDVTGCQTKEVIERAIGERLSVPSKKNQRSVCDCLLGSDVGAYDSCGHLCKYCYANSDKEKVLLNMKRHDKNSPFLIGNYEEGDIVTDAKQKSYIDLQMCLF